MCRKSKTFLKGISISLLLLLLLASPCYAAGRWYAISGIKEKPLELQNQQLPEQIENVSEENPLTIKQEESSQTISTTQSEMLDQEILEKLENLLSKYEMESINFENQSNELTDTLTKLDVQLQNLENNDAISEAEYQSVKASMISVIDANNKQADKIAKLEKESKSKAYGKVNGVIGFKDSLPAWGIGGAIGVRIGNSFMIEAGADYMLGDFANPINLKWDLDNLRITTGVGWMF